jgi:transposase
MLFGCANGITNQAPRIPPSGLSAKIAAIHSLRRKDRPNLDRTLLFGNAASLDTANFEMGFVSAPLYMFPKFFEGKATEHLIGEGVKGEHLNDDRLGRVLDKLYSTGLEQLFTSIALKAANKYGVSTHSVHLDSSSFHVHGKYEWELPKVTFISGELNRDKPNWPDIEEKVAPSPIEITYGYSRDDRPDLKQFILDLISSGDGDVPLFLRVADGNEADNAVFAKILCEFREQLTLDSLMVVDSALYGAPNLALVTNLKWLCRVPLTIKEANGKPNVSTARWRLMPLVHL